MGNFLWLDDVRPTPTPDGWDWVKDDDAFAAYVDTHAVPDLVSLDHDLSAAHYDDWAARMRGEDPPPVSDDGIGTGLDCVKYMIEKRWFPATVVVHTMNQWGRWNMVNALTGVGYVPAGYTAVLNAFHASPVLRNFDA